MQGFSYDQLYDALQSWPRKSSPQYLTDLDRIIQLGELRLVKELNIELFDGVDTTTVTASSRVVPKPVGMLSIRSAWLVTGTVRSQLYRRSKDWCLAYAPNPSTLGTPAYFAELDDADLYLVPTPTLTATLESHGPVRPESIVDAGNTWLGDNCGELLFHACLMEAENWLKSDDRLADIRGQYLESLQVWKLENRHLIKAGEYTPVAAAATKIG